MIPSDQESVITSNSSTAREEQRMRQLFPDEFSDEAQGDQSGKENLEDSAESSEEESKCTSSENKDNSTARMEIPHGIMQQFQEQDARQKQFGMQVGKLQQAQLINREFLEQKLTG